MSMTKTASPMLGVELHPDSREVIPTCHKRTKAEISMTSMEMPMNILEQQQREEATIISYLKGCTIQKVEYHSITLEMYVYLPFEPPGILGYRRPYIYCPEPIFTKKGKGAEGQFQPPVTNLKIYYYRNITTGNTVEICESDRKYRDKYKTTYNSMRVKFKSDKRNITKEEIIHFVSILSRYYENRMQEISDLFISQDDNESIDPEMFEIVPMQMFYVEPSVNICGPKKSIDFLHGNLQKNLYMTRCTKRQSVTGKGKVAKKLNDGRIVNNENAIDYISRKTRVYRYTLKGKHYLRIELMIHKTYMRGKSILSADSAEIEQLFRANRTPAFP
jgi:hypothetical protein